MIPWVCFLKIDLAKNRGFNPVNWCAYNTTGIKEMDFIFVDKNLIRADEKHLYSEKVVYLKDIWNAHFDFKKREKYPPNY